MNHVRIYSTIRRRLLFLLAGALILCIGLASPVYPQLKKTDPWQAAAGGSMSFEVASVRPDKSSAIGGANVDLLAGDAFTPTGGIYRATNVGLPELISFAYKLPMNISSKR